ncbi:hypothetical protein DFP78_106147 [Photobacterium lutimaris]|nr:hypothetical protein DFP78_106147 [Photobacterium lutimaris]
MSTCQLDVKSDQKMIMRTVFTIKLLCFGTVIAL